MIIFVIKALIKVRLIKYLNITIPLSSNNGKVNIPILAGVGLANIFDAEIWMDQILEILSSKVKKGAFFDVGVNIGQTMLKVKKNFVSNDIYIGFEPNPNCLYYCHKLISDNRCKKTPY